MIGVYDSGIGGVSILRAIQQWLPHHNLLYLADTAYCPYGPLPIETVRERAIQCSAWLHNQGSALVVVACNTASSAALETLRETFTLPIVGMEPGIKPATQATRSRRVGVLATGGTLAGARFARLMQRFASDVAVQTVPCPALVEQVEAGELDTPRTRALLQQYIGPLLAQGVDTVVLGCTHFHFLAPTIAALFGPTLTIIETAGAVARRVAHVALESSIGPDNGTVGFASTGEPVQRAQMERLLVHLWGGVPVGAAHIPATTVALHAWR